MGTKDHARFTYSPLTDAKTNIRLINIATDPTKPPQTERLRISVLTRLLDHLPAYHAISYAWGKPSEAEEITVVIDDGEEYMTVGKNCANVLRQVAHFETAKYYWVDAICINQNDENEKGAQISMMGRIFSGAENVLACIGMPPVDGQFPTYLLRKFDDYLRTNGQSTGTFIKEIKHGSSPESARLLQLSERWVNQLSHEDTVRFSQSLDEIAGISYFKRIWILQEVFLARHIRVFYGFDELSLATLLFWREHSRPDHSYRGGDNSSPLLYTKLRQSGSGSAYVESLRMGVGDFSEAFFTEKGGSRLGAANDDFLCRCALAIELNDAKDPISLGDVLDLCETRSCKDPRDTVYGTLALANWSDAREMTLDGKCHRPTEKTLRPDYTRSALDLAKDILPYFNTIDQTLQIFNMLKLRLTGTRISDELVRRQHSVSSDLIESDDCVLSSAKRSSQKHVQVAGGCVQITRDGPWRLKHCEGQSGRYCRILDSNAALCGLGNAGISTGDWVFPTFSGFGFALRQISANSLFYAVVGRITWLPQAMLDDAQVTAFILVIGIDDIVAHLMQSDEFWDNWSDRTRPKQALQVALNLPFCAASYSSFAVIPGEKRKTLREAFKDDKSVEFITITLLLEWRHRLSKM
jgi:hypothetical protein